MDSRRPPSLRDGAAPHHERPSKSRNEHLGSVTHHDIIADYISFLTAHFTHLKGNRVNAVIDCGNGSAGSVMPLLIKAMGWQNVRLLFAEVDGTFPNHEADPTVKENMEFVKQTLEQDPSLTLGIGFDGDADRMNPMTKEGDLVPGDKLLALFAQDVIKKHPGAAVVFDIKSSQALIQTLEAIKARPCVAPSGHSLIKEAIIHNNALLAGELSCHFFFKDRYFGYDDGIYAALRLIEMVATTGKSLTQLVQSLPVRVSSPEFRIKCTNDEIKQQIVSHVKDIFAARKDVAIITIDGVRAQMTYGWGLARASNTQPVISLRFESDTTEGLGLVKDDFVMALQPFFDVTALKDEFERT
jgi:phosphomannomutase/phosphoglucomutase